jgi:hypothetical protein
MGLRANVSVLGEVTGFLPLLGIDPIFLMSSAFSLVTTMTELIHICRNSGREKLHLLWI